MGAQFAHEPKRQAAPEAVGEALAGPGRALESEVRADMALRFGHDFSRVRVHTDARAAESARAVGARAFTVGSEIVFGEREYDPASGAGRKLLAHELAHTVQQSAFASAPVPHSGSLAIEPAETSLERAAADSAGRGTSGAAALGRAPGLAVQRQPVAQEEEEAPITIFVAEDRKRRDVRFARRQAQLDAARITKGGKLSSEERSLVKAKLRFFEGDAWRVYGETIKPALTLATMEDIEMPAEQVGIIDTPAQASYQYGEFFNMVRQQPTYLDNDIKEIHYFAAEMAHILYRDGTKYELGLVSKWMKPPVVEVDYGTPLDEIRPFEDPVMKRFGFMLERELATAPRTMPFSELVKKYVHFVEFPIEPGTARIVPTRINMLTAPTLCEVLRDSYRQYAENVQLAADIGLHGTAAIGGYAGGGGFSKGIGVTATKAFQQVAPRVLSPSGRKLWAEMDDLLAQGGTKTIEVEGMKFVDVTVTKQGSVLAVRRFESKLAPNLRGGGTGTRLAKDFEDAAAEVGRRNGARTVTVDVGIITNPGWREVLESLGYVYTPKQGGWIKTITVVVP
jgi:hypothetical protein